MWKYVTKTRDVVQMNFEIYSLLISSPKEINQLALSYPCDPGLNRVKTLYIDNKKCYPSKDNNILQRARGKNFL